MTKEQWEEICKEVYTNEQKYLKENTYAKTNQEKWMFQLGIRQTMEIIRVNLFGKDEE